MQAGIGFLEIHPTEVRELLGRGAALRLIDVREPLEHRVARIEGAELIPLGDIPDAAVWLPRDEDLVLVCHHGIRSAQACRYLLGAGFERVRNMTGGIDLWSVAVDPSVPRY
jgi:rhodanese-related sulfurtransferase